ncbi:NUDIX hydrolase [Patescibacteria group bacterium]|nr:NUDIX hydrolase [Patescibacteria group bacterium]MBU1500442.1 NUDIX hydrolase [Patescibacteria group bacterium]MBU2080510.1 NUDIX hydrolase [Patescibacteria group bacterium]MBU2123685.1 NUDIX hydrolase [Patescibacteria group bacterium]MBU2194541.1 NUDIX hydrolase [Patescibacteria group bacterium]
MELPECFYRISVKALILNEERDKFLLVKEEGNNKWELPGGGLDWGMSPQEDVKREVKEEMGLEVSWVAEHPSYFLTDLSHLPDRPRANVIYEVRVTSLDFTPSDECVEIRFVDAAEARELDLFENVHIFTGLFDASRHST